MKLITVGAAALNQTPLDWEGNKQNIISAVVAAKDCGVSVLCLPELCISGYGCEDTFHSRALHATALEVLEELRPETKGIVVSVGLPLFYQGGVFNTCCLLVNGKIAGFVAKHSLAGDGIHYEPRWFKPWPDGIQVQLEIGKSEYPLGDIHFDLDGIKLGFEICEDAWSAERPGVALSRKGVDIILNPSASHFAFGKHAIRERFITEGSRAFGVTYIYSNLLGNESGRAIYDGDTIVASQGRVIASGPRFSFKNFQLTAAQVDIDATRMARSKLASFSPTLAQQEPDRIELQFPFPKDRLRAAPAPVPSWERSDQLKFEEFSRAVPLGLFDYARKSRSRGFVVSLSGGRDSAAVCILIRLMVELGLEELSPKEFSQRLLGETAKCTTPAQFMALLLTAVYQKTRNSSKQTEEAAQSVAEEIGARYHSLDVDTLVEGYTSLVAGALGRELTWKEDDLALQNVQARVRAPSVWLLANIQQALLLTTSNRSEAAVGYATMDGDTAGGLAPLGGIDKAFIRRWLAWMENTGPIGLSQYPSLAKVNCQESTAELRPKELRQSDEADLMPYDVLDRIERAAILDRQSPTEILERLKGEFPKIPAATLTAWIRKFFRLWCRSQWKRERYAPAFHVDDESLDPRTWCRFPILSGGFERELGQLKG